MKNILLCFFCFVILGCGSTVKVKTDDIDSNTREVVSQTDSLKQTKTPKTIEIIVKKDVPIRSYFKWMDSLVHTQNKKQNYVINEYLIVHNNKWIVDTLANTDYYHLMDKGIFNEDSKSLIALKKGQVLVIPDSIKTLELKTQLANTYLDLNIPEFRLRIVQNDKELYNFIARVGKNGTRFMAMAKREVDMRTRPGIGEIIRVNKYPDFINPENNRPYTSTSRDDGKRTQLPAIPWLEPAINGVSHGHLIHPTTNLATLGKASSNGCVGLRESDAWMVYYYAPLGTKVIFRYDLKGENDKGETIKFKNIYPEFEKIKINYNHKDVNLNKISPFLAHICDC